MASAAPEVVEFTAISGWTPCERLDVRDTLEIDVPVLHATEEIDDEDVLVPQVTDDIIDSSGRKLLEAIPPVTLERSKERIAEQFVDFFVTHPFQIFSVVLSRTFCLNMEM